MYLAEPLENQRAQQNTVKYISVDATYLFLNLEFQLPTLSGKKWKPKQI